MRYFLAVLSILITTTAQADDHVVCNENGAVVTLDDGTVYYLGKTCDAAKKDGGSGRWWLTASAFAIEIDGRAMLLPFEVNCEVLPACWATN